MPIQWNPQTMATGVADVDAQHQEWIRRYNEFDQAIHSQHGMDTVRKTLDFFIKYADTHFTLEEARMDEKHCPAAEANREAHKVMRNMLLGFEKYLDQNGVSTTDVILLKIDMENWLIHHILTVDIQLRDC